MCNKFFSHLENMITTTFTNIINTSATLAIIVSMLNDLDSVGSVGSSTFCFLLLEDLVLCDSFFFLPFATLS